MTPAQIVQLLSEEENKLIDYTFLASEAAPKSITFAAPERRNGCSWIVSRLAQRLAERVDASVCAVDANLHWPAEIAGQKMETYHEWMKAVLLVSMSGSPALAVPAGFGGARNLPMGIQIVAANRRELDCLQLGYAYTMAANWSNARLPGLLS